MTRSEAIKRFETLLLHVDTDCVMGMETTEAINMAIKALEQPEIVYCGECENMRVDELFYDCWCKDTGKKVWIDHYCSCGKRKGNEHNN